MGGMEHKALRLSNTPALDSSLAATVRFRVLGLGFRVLTLQADGSVHAQRLGLKLKEARIVEREGNVYGPLPRRDCGGVPALSCAHFGSSCVAHVGSCAVCLGIEQFSSHSKAFRLCYTNRGCRGVGFRA